jgi:hypothetical protein
LELKVGLVHGLVDSLWEAGYRRLAQRFQDNTTRGLL